MEEIVRVILSCRDRRQAFHLGKAILHVRLASGMNFEVGGHREAWEAGRRCASDVPLVLSTLARAVPFIEAKVVELHPSDPPPLVGGFGDPAGCFLVDFVRSKVVVPALH